MLNHASTSTLLEWVHESVFLFSPPQPLGGSGLRLTFEHRSRALLCLIHVADPATLEALSHTPRDKVKYVPSVLKLRNVSCSVNHVLHNFLNIIISVILEQSLFVSLFK